ncbi:Hsp20/alpha crystallin family protein [Chitinophaga agrisoli]|uniref:Hsp20/alpha crystallin family protein n=1 Tax=Chitinophaga agrisoli TaxID=2607653 RepID=A0A5B2VND9_9BACT|nr:Hsp20/alpha crystallin family protein [Chitinophaga agrisoli]KAA2239659.1 Hsp20/alpha crystallin family protein [Chitinophaga agrisoli]
MTLVKFNHHPAHRTFGGLIDEVFNNTARVWKDDVLTNDFFGTYPPVNIQESKETYALDILVPGWSKEDFKINLENNVLTISAEKKAEQKNEDQKQIRREFSFRSFKRSFSLDETVDAEKIQAKYENGVLQVQLPKKEQDLPKSKSITVA